LALGTIVLLGATAIGPCGGGDDEDEEPTETATAAESRSPGGGAGGIEDPLPDADEPGLVTCAGCAEVEGIDDFEPEYGDVPAQQFSGTAAGAEGNGRFYVEGEDGQAYDGNIETDESGAWTVTVPLICGRQTIKLAWTNDSGTSGAVLSATRGDCRSGGLRITLSWDGEGLDFELHLIREGGVINDDAEDCTWTSCIGVSPDWGVAGDESDNPSKDVDDTDAFGPENIVYPEPAAGRYMVLVEHWGAGEPGASGSLVINVEGKPPVEIPIDSLDPQKVFIAASIDWPSGEVTVIGDVYDCTANWDRGCRDPIP
jgi:hypothetical protein